MCVCVDSVLGVGVRGCTVAVRFHSTWSVVLIVRIKQAFQDRQACAFTICTIDTHTASTDTHRRNGVRIEKNQVPEVANQHKTRPSTNRITSNCARAETVKHATCDDVRKKTPNVKAKTSVCLCQKKKICKFRVHKKTTVCRAYGNPYISYQAQDHRKTHDIATRIRTEKS